MCSGIVTGSRGIGSFGWQVEDSDKQVCWVDWGWGILKEWVAGRRRLLETKRVAFVSNVISVCVSRGHWLVSKQWYYSQRVSGWKDDVIDIVEKVRCAEDSRREALSGGDAALV